MMHSANSSAVVARYPVIKEGIADSELGSFASASDRVGHSNGINMSAFGPPKNDLDSIQGIII